MTPDTLVIDRTFKGVGRIKKATGTLNPAVRRKISRMLTALFDDGKLDVLRAIRDGDISMMETYEAYQRHALDRLPTGGTAKLLRAAFDAWVNQLQVPSDCSADHIRSLGCSAKEFTKAKKKATVAELPAVLERMRNTVGLQYPRTFNLARAHALAFVRSTLKRSHPLWSAVAAVELRKVPATKQRRPLTVVQMRGFFPAPATDPVDAIAWSMATTGMHQKELWGEWENQGTHIRVVGTKREGRVRDIPLVMAPVVPSMHRRTFEDKLRERTSRAIVPYDLRRTYANWMESAGIPRTRRRMYLGHGASDVTDLYEQHEVAAYLLEDRAKLRAHIGTDLDVAGLRLVKEA